MKLRIANCELRIPPSCDSTATPANSPFEIRGSKSSAAFTLIEIMVVVAIIAVIMGIGIPAFYNSLKAEGLRKAVNDVQEACNKARAQAIMSGASAELHFNPVERTFSVSGGSAPTGLDADGNPAPAPAPSGSSGSWQLPDSVSLEMLYVNMVERKDADSATVKFYPNGTCDEMVLVLESEKRELRAISLEITTGLASVETDPRKLLR
jgi:prepilin-type N-terminal cleavage/methylation domain-containing protein